MKPARYTIQTARIRIAIDVPINHCDLHTLRLRPPHIAREAKAALTELFSEVKEGDIPVIVFVRFDGWQVTNAGERAVKQELRKISLRHVQDKRSAHDLWIPGDHILLLYQLGSPSSEDGPSSLKHKDPCLLHAPHSSPESMNRVDKECHLKAAIEKAAMIVEAPAKGRRRDAENLTERQHLLCCYTALRVGRKVRS